jgi:hypothetical protein
MNRVDPAGGSLHLVVGTEGQAEHRCHRPVRSPKVRNQPRSKTAVLRNGGGDEWMRELQQDGPSPAQKHNNFPIHLIHHLAARH